MLQRREVLEKYVNTVTIQLAKSLTPANVVDYEPYIGA